MLAYRYRALPENFTTPVPNPIPIPNPNPKPGWWNSPGAPRYRTASHHL